MRAAAALCTSMLCLASLAPGDVAADTGAILADRWYAEPLLYPQLGYMSFRGPSGTVGVAQTGLGVGGLFHDLDGGLLSGRARAEGSVWTGGDGLGFEVRLGPSWTPRMRWWGARVGIDPFYNRFTSSVAVLPPTFGVDFPVDVLLGPRQAYLIAGLTPAWVANPERRVDWSETSSLLPVGHESEWRLGFGLTLGRFGVTLVYSQRATVMGVSSGVGVGFSQAPYVPPDKDKED